MTKMIEKAGEVLEFWFGELRDGWPTEDRGGLWFRDGAKNDPEITQRFGETLARAGRGELNDWTKTAEGALALIIVLDQFTRCVHRGNGVRRFPTTGARLRRRSAFCRADGTGVWRWRTASLFICR